MTGPRAERVACGGAGDQGRGGRGVGWGARRGLGRSGAGDLWVDAGLAVLCAVAGQLVLVDRADRWVWGPHWLVIVVALLPLLVAVRRIDPVLALAGLIAGSYVYSLLLGEVPWGLLTGCVLAAWMLPAHYGPRKNLVLLFLITGLPAFADRGQWSQVMALYPAIYQRIDYPGGGSSETGGIDPAAYDQLRAGSWPDWASFAIAAVGMVAVLVAWRRGVTPNRRGAAQRLEDLSAFVRVKWNSAPMDLLIASAAASAVLIDLWVDQVRDGNWWSAPGWMPAAVVGATATLVVRSRWPEIPVVALSIAALVTYWQTNESLPLLLALAVALFSLGLTSRLRWSVPTAVLVLAALPTIAALIRYPQLVLMFPELKVQQLHGESIRGTYDGFEHNWIYEEMVDRQWPLTLSFALLLAVVAGIALRLYSGNRAAAVVQAELAEVAANREAEQVVLTERAMIARDLHDVVAHAVNLMVIQAETGPDLVARGERDTLAGFQRIGDAGRKALGELDRLLSALRDPDGIPDPQLAPQPGLAEVERLVADVADDRLEIEYSLSGDPEQPPEGQQVTVYRLIQEALTNVVRHGNATKVTVTVEIAEPGIRVEVVDDGIGFDPDAAGREGRHGLAGMRERVRVHEGRLDVRSAPGTGATISAFLPAVTR